MLIGNLTRDPELRYTPQGTAVCTIGIATNRSWATDNGERKEETEFHRIVAWNKLAELCGQLLFKGRKVFVEGRLSTRTWVSNTDNQQHTVTEIIIEDMILLDSKRQEGAPGYVARPQQSTTPAAAPAGAAAAPVVAATNVTPTAVPATPVVTAEEEVKTEEKTEAVEEKKVETAEETKDKVDTDDIPF